MNLIDKRIVVDGKDDGLGGAQAFAGSGLHGLTDRVESLKGQLNVTSRMVPERPTDRPYRAVLRARARNDAER